jgi:hypothetical protein
MRLGGEPTGRIHRRDLKGSSQADLTRPNAAIGHGNSAALNIQRCYELFCAFTLEGGQFRARRGTASMAGDSLFGERDWMEH